MSAQRTMQKVVGLLAMGAGLSACGAPPVAKSNPTWEADVYPILQGQCLHCHGKQPSTELAGAFRLSFFDLKKQCPDIDFGASPPTFTGADDLLRTIVPDTDNEAKRATMPPVPAPILEDWERNTLKNFYDGKKLRGTRVNNRKPSIELTSDLPEKVSGNLRVSYRFKDSDGDPVVGILKIGGVQVNAVADSGEIELKSVMGNSGEKLKLTAQICDGWDQVTKDLGEITKE